MTPRHTRLLAALVLTTACAVDDLRPDYEAARELVAARTGEHDVFDPDGPALDAAALDAALADGLGRDEAVRLALLNSRRLQAGFMELGVARADYVQSGLLQNPTLGLGFLFPAGDARTRTFVNLGMDVSQLWRLREGRLVTEAAMEQRLFELGRLAGRLVADTRSTYDRAVAARQRAEAAQATAAVARERHAALASRVVQGVATELEAQAAQGEALAAELDARRAERDVAAAVRELAGLLSLTGDLRDVPLRDGLPAVPDAALDREALVARAVASRLDLRALDAAVRSAEARVALEDARSGADVQAGVGYERPESDSPTDHVLGPTFGLELPLFDRNEAQISRATYELERLRREREALDADVRQQVRAAADDVALAAGSARFLRDELLPQAERRAELARSAFQQGGVTRMTLLDAEREVARARALQVESALEAALAVVALERALGGPLPEDARP